MFFLYKNGIGIIFGGDIERIAGIGEAGAMELKAILRDARQESVGSRVADGRNRLRISGKACKACQAKEQYLSEEPHCTKFGAKIQKKIEK